MNEHYDYKLLQFTIIVTVYITVVIVAVFFFAISHKQLFHEKFVFKTNASPVD